MIPPALTRRDVCILCLLLLLGFALRFQRNGEQAPLGDEKIYVAYLEWQMAEGPAGKSQAYVNMSRGWALGTQDFKVALVQDHAIAADVRALELCGKQEVNEVRWSAALERGLSALGKSPSDASNEPKSAPWKLALAAWLKHHTDANNRWLATHLHLGTPGAFAHNLTYFRRTDPGKNRSWKTLTSRS